MIKKMIREAICNRLNISRAEFNMLYHKQGDVFNKVSSRRIRSLLEKMNPVTSDGLELIRFGPDFDGGYLLPNDLDGVAACFSPGVGKESGFELMCAQHGMDVYMADASVDGPSAKNERFHFINKFLGSYQDDTYITMENWVKQSGVAPNEDLILQIDIEGAEYELLFSVPDWILNRSRIIIIEFHWLTDLRHERFFQLFSRVIEKLLQDHVCVHLHPANSGHTVAFDGIVIPELIECTFLRKDRIGNTRKVESLPHPLDRDTYPDRDPIFLSKDWYGS